MGKVGDSGLLKLFWCSTLDGMNDWFVAARESEHARSFFASELGYQISEVQTALIVRLQRTGPEESTKWPSVEQIASVGEAFLSGNVVAAPRAVPGWSLDDWDAGVAGEA